MQRLYFLCLLFLLPPVNAAGEDRMLHIPAHSLSWFNPVTNIDSLEALLKKTGGREKVDMLCEIAYAYLRSGNYTPGHQKILAEALELSQKLNYNNGLVKANYLLSLYKHAENKDLAEGLLPVLEAETYFDSETHWTLRYRVWESIWRYSLSMNETGTAFQYHHKPLLLLDPDTAWLAHFNAHIGLMRQASITNEHIQKRQHLEAAKQIYEQHKELIYKGDNLFRMASELEEISINLAHYGEYRHAVDLMLELNGILSDPDKKKPYYDFFRAKVLGRIARIYNHWGKYDAALVYFDKSIECFDRFYVEYGSGMKKSLLPVSFRQWAINAANQLEERADVLIKSWRLQEAEDDLLESIRVRTEHDDPLGLGMCYDKMGTIYSLRYDFIEALNWFEQALEIKYVVLGQAMLRQHSSSALKLSFAKESIADTYIKIGRLYVLWDRHWLAVDYLNRSLAIARETNMQKTEAEALTALGSVYIKLEQPDSAHIFYDHAKTIYTRMGHNPGLAEIHESLGTLNHSQAFYEAALDHYIQSQHIYSSLEMMDRVAGLQIKQGNVLYKMQQTDEAIIRYFNGLDTAEELDLPKVRMDAHHGLSLLYAHLGAYEEAFRHHTQFIVLRDDLFAFETNLHIAEVEARYDAEKSRNRILLLEQAQQISQGREARNRLIMIGMSAFILLMILWLLLYLRHLRLKSINEQMLLQHKLLRTQLNPHFIFNSLGSIQSTIINKEPDKAIRYLSRFSKLMRTVLDGSLTEHVSIAGELATIENYLELQRVRFPDKFEYNISVDEGIDIENTCIPPMLVQPFIENALEHGFKHKTGKGRILVRLQPNSKGFSLEIEDNGVGRRKAGELLMEQDKDHKSLATSIIRQRIEVLNKKLIHKIKLSITDLFDAHGQPAGTRVMFEFPSDMHDCM